MSEVVHLGFSYEETAYHEAGHAAIELIYGFTPQLLLVKGCRGQISGECFSCAPTGKEHAAWRGEKAVAGVLAQALYVAGKRVGSQSLFLPAAPASDLVQFFFAPPDSFKSCVITIVGDTDQRSCPVELFGSYSDADYHHFRISIAEMTAEKMTGRKFFGNEPECMAAAEQCVSRCVDLLIAPFVWQYVSSLANRLIQSEAVTVHLIGRDGIESAAGLLWNYQESRSNRRN